MNKTDLKMASYNNGRRNSLNGNNNLFETAEQQFLHALMKVLPIEKYVYTSAKTFLGIKELFETASLAVMFPKRVVWEEEHERLRPRFQGALCRLFRMADKDRDQKLNFEEILWVQNFISSSNNTITKNSVYNIYR
eukprot:UN33610